MTIERVDNRSYGPKFSETDKLEVLSLELRRLGNKGTAENILPALAEWLTLDATKEAWEEEFLGQVEVAVKDGDLTTSLMLIADLVPVDLIHGSMTQSVSTLRRKAEVGLEAEENARRMEKGIKPVTTSVGSEAHVIAEQIMSDDDYLEFIGDDYDLIVENNYAIGIRKKSFDNQPEAIQTNFTDINLEDDNRTIFNRDSNEEVPQKDIYFEYPMLAPKEGEGKRLWAMKILKEELSKVLPTKELRIYDDQLDDMDETTSYDVQINNWAGRQRRNAPHKPHDIVKLLESDESKESLTKLMQVGQFLFGSENGLSQVSWEGEVGRIGSTNVDKFKTLDVLVLERMVIERYQGQKYSLDSEVVLTEVNEGNMSVSYGGGRTEKGKQRKLTGSQEVKLGKIDLLTVGFLSTREYSQKYDRKLNAPLYDPNLEKTVALDNYKNTLIEIVGGENGQPTFENLSIGNIPLVLNLLSYMDRTNGSVIYGQGEVAWKPEEVRSWKTLIDTRIASGEFGKNPGLEIGDAIKIVEKKFRREGRNLQNLIKGLYEIYGERVLSDIYFDVGDLKFLVGDGGWHSVFLTENLPQSGDMHQVEDYLFKIAAQMLLIRNWSEGIKARNNRVHIDDNSEHIQNSSPTVTKVTEFIQKNKLSTRITGKILYQTPLEQIPVEVGLNKSRRVLSNLGKRAFRVAPEKNEITTTRTKILKAINIITAHRQKGVPEVIREIDKMPEDLDGFCIQDPNGKTYLCIDDLNALLNPHDKRQEILQAAVLNEKTKVFWIKGLIPSSENLRICIDDQGRYSIDGIPGKKLIKGKLLSSRDYVGTNENPKALSLYFEATVWREIQESLGKQPLNVNESTILGDFGNGQEIRVLMPNGTLKPILPGKIPVCSWDGMSRVWKLNFSKLDKDVRTRRDNTHGYVSLRNWIVSKKQQTRSMKCLVHDNTDTPAAAYYPKKGIIKCMNGECGCTIDISDALGIKKHHKEIRPGAENYSISNYETMSPEREELVSRTFETAKIFAHEDTTATDYLDHIRGINPNIVGEYGYLPPMVSSVLWELSQKAGLVELVASVPELRIDEIHEYGNSPELHKKADEVVNLIREVAPKNNAELLDLLSISTILKMSDLEKHAILAKWNPAAGGIMFPLRVPDSKDSRTWKTTNIFSRRIEMNGKKYNRGKIPHWKLKLEETDSLLEQPSAGVWVRDPQEFLTKIDETKTVFSWEGTLNALAYYQIAGIEGWSDLVGNSFANTGTGYELGYAVLRQLGIEADKRPPKGSLGLGIKRIVIASDPDGPGSGVWERRSKELQAIFPGIEVLPIHEFVPAEIKSLFLPYDTSLYGNKSQPEKYYGRKIDVADILGAHGSDWGEKNKLTPDEVSLVAELRQKYAYKG